MDFNTLAKQKFVENLLSVKIWVIFAFLIASSFFLYTGLISGALWVSGNGGIISTVFGMREAFKVAKIRANVNNADKMMV